MKEAIQLMRSFLIFLKLAYKLWKLDHDGIWDAAGHAVSSIMAQNDLAYAAEKEPRTRFCPMCGQIPDGDRRMDHARKIVCEILAGKTLRRNEIDAAISLHYLLRKRNK